MAKAGECRVCCDRGPRTRHSKCERTVRLAVSLGYDYAAREDVSIPIPLTTLVLPVNPFTIIWPFVIIRELVLDADGHAILDRRYRETIKRKVRLLPRH